MKQLRISLVALFFVLVASAFAQPANDNFANRFVITGQLVSTNGTTVGATRETGEPFVFSGVGSVWYEWTAIYSSSVTISITGNYRETIAAYTGTAVNALTTRGSASAFNGGTSASFSFIATAGTAYKIQVDGRATTGNFTLTVNQPTPVPVVAITTPTSGSSFTNPTTVTITATASSPAGGTITNVTFYQGATVLGVVTNTPYTMVWSNIADGNYTLTAHAIDTLGLNGSSAGVGVTIRPFGYFSMQLVGSNSVFGSNSWWKYKDDGTDQGTAWQSWGFDDSAWAAGPAEIGYGEVSARGATTNVNYGPDPNNKYITTYFRHSFTVTNASVITNLVARFERDDGMVMYLNGVEVARNNVAAGQDYSTSAIANAADDGTTFFSTNINPALLTNGVNVLATEIHQDLVTSSDITWYLELTASGANGNAAPSVSILTPTNGAVLTAGANVTLTAIATDSDGTVTNVAYYANAVKLGDVTNGPSYSFTWTNPAQGSYALTAVATDNGGASTTSGGVGVTVNTYTVVPVSLIGTGAVWKYLDNGTDQGSGWTALGFNDSAWASGPQQLGYGDGDEATVVSFGPDPNNKYITTYFRYALTVTNVSVISNLTMNLLRDDGAVVYFNGTEVFRTNMPAGPIAFNTLASSQSEYPFDVITLPTTGLVTGNNIVAVEIHQGAPASSDISMELELIANTLKALPPTNAAAPFVQTQNPLANTTVSSLTSVQVTFSEAVTNVDAADLHVNGVPATGLSGGPSTYTFTFTQPPLGTVNIRWAAANGIQDLDPSPLPFDGTASSNVWSYNLADTIAPTVVSKVPAAGATLSNLTSVQVTFSENVIGVDASDFLINGSPAVGLTGSGSNYTFGFSQPGSGTVNISWASSHGITDTAGNPFNASGAGATWSYTMQAPRVTLVASNAFYRFRPGTNEASNPTDAWHTNSFDDSTWVAGQAPYYYDDDQTPIPYSGNTLIVGMRSNYSCIFLRSKFVITNAVFYTNLVINSVIDDGFIVWLNGVEIRRYNFPAGNFTYQTLANNAGEPLTVQSFSVPNPSPLVEGTNILAVQGFNSTLTSSDLEMMFNLTAEFLDPGSQAPRIFSVNPPSGSVFALTNITITFTKAVTNVDAGDLLINGVAATSLVASNNTTYTFGFAQPAFGNVSVTWAVNHGITDLSVPANPFDGTAAGSTFSYSLVNPNAPTIASQTPAAGATVNSLTQIQVTFSKAVTGVDASDLLINGLAATGLSGSGSNYTFTFAQPSYGTINITWAASHGIADLSANAFDATRPGATWQYNLVDQIPPTVASQTPPAGANVTNLTGLLVRFSENVIGVNASDLLLNGVPATGVTGSGSNYIFNFSQPNSSIINVTWAVGHGITDTATVPNAFDGNGSGATWQYFTPDTVAPTVTSIDPPANITVRNLTQVAVTFSEPVIGVNASDLQINNQPASSVVGSAAGPYTFTFAQPANGTVELIWAPGHGITDLASPPNAFAGGEWTYNLDPNAVFANKIVINEIMWQPASKSTNDEWIELYNTDTAAINLTDWQFTKGVDFTFPNVTIPSHGYLVVCADSNAFHTKFPTVTNYIGNWNGDLANHDGNIQLETPLGEIANTLHYASEGDWAVRTLGPLDNSYRGWSWVAGANAGGKSFELMNPLMPNQSGQNWRSSTPNNGTPGTVNSVYTTNIAPLILEVGHFPVVPHSTDPVVITASVFDERTNIGAVRLFYRNAATLSPGAFTVAQMFDDGAHNDGVSGDKVFAATIPAQTNDAIIEFYVEAVDQDNLTNSSPALAVDQNGVPGHLANALYQVDDRSYPYSQPIYKFIMTAQEALNLDNIARNSPAGADLSNAEMNNTFISIDGTGTEIRYGCGIRERGNGTRGRYPANQRINVPTDRRWKGQREFNLNTQYTESQYAGYLMSIRSGMDTEWARIVRVRLNNVDRAQSGSPQFGCYIHLESPNSDQAQAHWPLDDGGNVYRCISPGHATTLAVLSPPTANTYSNAGYAKVSNTTENDYSDLTNLTYVLNIVPDSIYEASIRSNINVEQWMLYFAVGSLLENEETALNSGFGDDYGMYHAPRENKFYLTCHDWDTVLGEGDTAGVVTQNIFRSTNVLAIGRFMRWTNFTPIYYNTLRKLCTTTFAPSNAWKTLDEGLGDFVPQATINNMKTFLSNRVSYVLSQLPPTTLASSVSGTLSGNVRFAQASSPYTVTANLTIPSGCTLTIDPGVTVQVAAGVTITVSGTGVLLAQGTPSQHIRFTKSTASNWGSLDFIGAPNESRIEYADFDSCAGTTIGGHAAEVHVNGGSKVFFNYLSFTNNPAQEYISFDGSSFIVQNSGFPTYPWATSAPEMLHGINGIPAGGYGIFRSNYFGHTFGFNDTIDFTGGQRPGPILQFIGNIFDGAGDDCLDLDSTDAWIEGNTFMHVHRDPNRTDQADDTGSGISGGVDFDGQFSEWTVINNLFYDVDHACLNKGGVGSGGGRFIFLNNTLVHVNKESGGGPSTNIAAFIFTDDQVAYPNPSYGAGAYVAGNIIWDCAKLVDNYNTNNHTIVFENNILSVPVPADLAGRSSNNVVTDPMLNLQLITTVTNATAAQVRAAFMPKTNSPALGTGFGVAPYNLDKGGLNPKGLLIINGPSGDTNSSSASFKLFPGGVFHWGTFAPNYDWGYTHYKWKLDDGPWSSELAISNNPTINLSGLPDGSHTLFVSGKNDAGYYQDDMFVYPTDGVIPAHVTASHTWTINSSGSGMRINEVLASNGSVVNHEGTFPDIIELQNVTDAAIDLGGMRLTDDASNPDKFTFAAGTIVPPGGYLVVYANDPDGTSGIHTGFSISKDGQSLYLYANVDDGGTLVDSITFGLQVTDYSIGRVNGSWTLCVPTFGAANVAATLGNPTKLLINEILASEIVSFSDDFVEIFNPQNAPVAMSALFFTDNPAHWPNESPVPALTFIGASNYIAFRADGNADKGADHLSFSLAAERGVVALLNSDYSVIDCYVYGPQSTDISQGRSPLNTAQNNFFTTPTPGAPNPGIIATNTGVVINELLANNSTVREADGSTPDWVELYNLSATSVNLDDYSLTDSSLIPRKYVFTNVIIAAHGYLRLRCDGSQLASSTNTGFGLNAQGGGLFLFDKLSNGGALLNSVAYGLQATDFSISRIPDGTGPWTLSLPTPSSANIVASFATPNSVKVNEWMAAPSSGEDWFELWNPNIQPVAIGGYYLTDDLNNRTKSQIPALSYLGGSTNGYTRFWADSTPSAGANHANFKLSNTGEAIGFANPSGTLIDSITFGAQQTGVSEGRFPDGTAAIGGGSGPSGWTRFPNTASPNEPNYLLLSNIVINEALTHTDLPLEDAIELRNLTGTNVDISGWWLSDSKGNLRKYHITNGVIVLANAFKVFYEYQFNEDPTNNKLAFALSSHGDQVYLSAADTNGTLTGYRAIVSFDAAQNGVSFGRYVTSDNREEFVAMSSRSLGQDDPGTVQQFRTGTGLPNPYPKIGPVVISQIMYHPPDIGTNDDTLDEFIELKNITGSAVQLYQPVTLTNTWHLRDAISFDLPPGVSLAAGGNLLVVSFDPVNNPGQLSLFRGKWGIPSSVPVYGPWTGKLKNSDDSIKLNLPDTVDPDGSVPYVLVDQVHYFDAPPWPAAADGTGSSLQRVSLTGFGNDPTNWFAAAPNFGGTVDSDGDGMPDAWEIQNGLNPNDPSDANLDPDGDGLTNLQEYLSGTNPHDANSALRITSIEELSTNVAQVTFFAVSNRTYTITFKNTLGDPSWTPLVTFSSVPTNRIVQTNITVPTSLRFFRLRTP